MCRLWCARVPALGEGVAQHPSLSVDLSTGLSSTLQAGGSHQPKQPSSQAPGGARGLLSLGSDVGWALRGSPLTGGFGDGCF